jgi:hypothetical protein
VGRLKAADQAKRDRAIVADRARGLRWATIAERHQITTRRAQQIWESWCNEEYLDAPDSRLDVMSEIAILDAAVEEYADLARETKNDAVKLGALKAKLDAQAKRVDMKQHLGLLPSALVKARLEADVQHLLDAWELAEHKLHLALPQEVLDEFIETVNKLLQDDPRVLRIEAETAARKRRAGLESERRALERERHSAHRAAPPAAPNETSSD